MLNEKDNRNKLSDADILKEVDLSKNLPASRQEINSAPDKAGSDFVDSSLFVLDEFPEDDKTSMSQPNQSQKVTGFIKPIKNNDPIKSAALSGEQGGNEYFRAKNISDSNDDVITIKADKNDASNYLGWKIVGFALILIALSVGAYIFINNKKEKIAVEPEEVKTEIATESTPADSLENVLVGDNQADKTGEVSKTEIDFLKMKIEVFNASGVAGAAGKVKDLLTEAKYENVEAKNYEKDMTGIAVFYKTEELKKGAEELADILKENDNKKEIKLSLSEENMESDVAVVLGK